MKKIYLLFLILFAFTTSVTVAQSSHDKISYQSVVRDGSNHLLYDTQVTVAVSIKNSGDAAVKYSETHTVTSNANGLISFLIGAGNNQNGNWDAVQWNHADITLVTSVNGNVLSTHTYPLSAVPYALYAKNADTAIYADSVNLNVVQNFIQSSGYLTDELQVLSISNDTIYLSKGGWMKLPAGFSGDYNDLTNKPDLKPVATSGDYNDLTNKPDINNATLTIQKNGTGVGTFTANASTDKTINITVPTKTSELNNDSGFITADDIPAAQVQSDWNQTSTTAVDYIKNKPENLVQDANYVHTDNNYTADEKTKLEGIAEGAEVNVQSDWEQADDTKDDFIKNKPAINDATLTIQVTNYDTTAFTANDADNATLILSKVAGTGSYNDLTNTPNIPAAANDAKLVIKKNGTEIGSFTANASENDTVNIEVPTKVGDLENDKGYITGYTEVDPTVNDATLTIQVTNYDTTAFTANDADNATLILSKVAGTGSYNDLTNTPTIPAAPGTLKTDNATAQEVSASEALSGNISLHKVSKTGSYNDLLNKPAINDATLTIQVTNYDTTAFTANDADNETLILSKVAGTGSYNDLTNTPTIPTVNDATLTIQVTNYDTTAFTANDADNETLILSKVAGTGSYNDLTNTPTIPAAPGTLKTDNATAQEVSASEALSGNISLHKVSKTGSYNDLLNKPAINDATLTIQVTNYDTTAFTANDADNETLILSKVAGTGSYNDLTNTPTIPTVNDATLTIQVTNYDTTAFTANDADNETLILSKVAGTGSYNDLTNTPTIPTVNDATLTIQVTNYDTTAFTANDADNETLILSKVAGTGSYNDLTNTPTIPAAPGTLKTDNATAQEVSASESLSGNISLHKVSKTGSYNDLLNKPAINDATLTIQVTNYDTTAFTANDADNETLILSKVAGTGSYNDLTNTPTIPTVNDATLTIQVTNYDTTAFTANDADNETLILSKVAGTGSYNDLTNTPTIPTVNDATLTIQVTNYDTTAFTANDADNETLILSKVAGTGSYNDLTNTPTIPAAPGTLKTDNATAQEVSASEALSGNISLHKVSKTGSYNDLLNKPAINDATLTIQVTNYDTTAFTANDADNETLVLSKVAGTGSYNDLTNTPPIPDAPGTLNTNNATTQEVSASESLSGNISLHKVSKTGSYNDLLNKPAINDATLTIQVTNYDTTAFTANDADNETLILSKVAGTGSYNDLTNTPNIPTSVTDLSDGSQYLKTSELCNTIQTNCPDVALKNGNNNFTGNNTFTNKNTFTDTNYVEKRGFSFDTPGKTTESNCQVMVNACDLLAVFDSLMKRMDSISNALAETKEELEELKKIMPPTVHVSPNVINSTAISATAIANGHGSDITSYEFCISTKKDMSENLQCYPNASNVYTFTGLTPNTLYYIMAKATNIVGTGVSEVDSARTFALAPTATVEIPDVEVSGGFQVKVSEISPKGKTDSVTVQVCYQQKQGSECPDKNDPSYTICTDPQLVTDTTIDIIRTITGLVPFKDYCVIVKVGNGDSTTVYGPYTATTSGIITLKINSNPEGGTINRCGGSVRVTYTATITGANTSDYKYSWKVGGTQQPDTTNILPYIYNQNTSNAIKVTCIANREGYTPLYDTISTTIFSTGSWPDIDVCEDDQLTVTVVRVGSNTIKSLNWGDGSNPISSPSGINDILNNASYTYNSAGTYTITANGGDNIYPCNVTRVVKFAEPVTYCTLSGEGAINTQNNQPLNNEASTGSRIDSVKDHQGNWYEVVQIGTQCWLKENMRCTTSPSTGTYIVYEPTSSSDNTIITSYTSKIAHWYNNDSITYAPKNYGLLYNWCAAMDTFRTGDNYGVEKATEDKYSDSDIWSCLFPGNRRGICPEGWHIPSNDEWTEMETVVNGGVPQFESPDHENGQRGTHGGKLATGCEWTNLNRLPASIRFEDSPGDYTYPDRNSSNFSALPSGHFTFSEKFDQAGPVASNATGSQLFTDAVFWSTEYDSSSTGAHAWTRSLRCNMTGMFYTNYNKTDGYSVRCVRDEESGGGGDTPSNPTLSVTSEATAPLIVCGSTTASVTYTASVMDGETPVVGDYNYVWSVPTGAAESTVNGDVCTVTYNKPGTYTVSCTASGTTPDPATLTVTVSGCPCTVTNLGANEVLGTESGTIMAVKDADSISYRVVQIGNQCWMAENLRSTQYSTDGNPEISGKIVPGGNEANLDTYGYLYTWSAVMNGAATSSTVPSGVQGICPSGWHVPSASEFSTLLDGEDNAREYAGKLAGGESGTWVSSTATATPGNYSYSERNKMGFNALPSGISLDDFGEEAYFWSSTEINSNDNAKALKLLYSSNESIISHGEFQTSKLSVRCLRDPETSTPTTTPCTGISSVNANETSTGESGNYTVTAVTDADGISYNTVKIGSQCWMAENLKSTIYSDNTDINGLFAPNGDDSKVSAYGYLYNWSAATKGANSTSAITTVVQGVCPIGWHVPSQTELSTMISSSSFTTQNAGKFNGYNNYSDFDNYTYLWTTTFDEMTEEGHIYYNGQSSLVGGEDTYCYSVRCVRDAESGGGGGDTPSTNPSLSLSASTGNLPARRCNGTASVTYTATIENDDAEGYQYSWNESDPVSSNSFMVNYSQVGNYEVSCTATKGNLTIPATITTIVEPGCPCTGINPDTNEVAGIENGTIVAVKDVDNIFYRVVQIGEGSTAQCWMAENLRSTRYYNGESYTDITNGSIDAPSSSVPNLYNPNNYGYLYNWVAATGNASLPDDDNNAYTRGICPAGWHLPSYNDVGILFNNALDLYSGYYFGAGKLAGDQPYETWINDDNCQEQDAPCNPDYGQRNITGFSAIRSQYYKYDSSNGNLSLYPYGAGYWTCYKDGNVCAFLNILNNNPTCSISGQYIYSAMSVRCVRDEESGGGDEPGGGGNSTAPTYSQITFTPGQYSCTVTIYNLNFNNSSNSGTIDLLCRRPSDSEWTSIIQSVAPVTNPNPTLQITRDTTGSGNYYFKVVITNSDNGETEYISDVINILQ